MFFILAGCRSSQPVTQQFYMLELPQAETFQWPEGASTIGGLCEVAEVNLAPAYATHQIAVREDSHQIRYFTFNEWAERPGQRLTRMITEFMDDHNVFSEVVHGRITRVPDHIIETDIHYIEIDTRNGSFNARIGGEFRLVDNNGGRRVVLSRSIDRHEELDGKNVNEFASSISRMFSEDLHGFSIECMQLVSGG